MHPQIIATIGKKTTEYTILKDIIQAGANIIRVNFSHATHDQWHEIKKNIKQIKQETGLTVKIMLDLQGPRIRVGVLPYEIHMQDGETYCFVSGKADFANKEIPVDFDNLSDEVKVGEPFYLANGLIAMQIIEIKDKKIYAKVENGGLLLSRKAINLPETNLSSGGLTEKDLADAKFGAENGADYICLSFVQSKEDLQKLREIISPKKVPLIAKIERATALNVIDEIIQYSDGIMVARGDLGIEIPMEELPIIQKNLIRNAHWHNKPAIVATEMLASMVNHKRPTRAEVSDVANAVFDGADAIMLSDETAAGEYPVEAVAVMKKISTKVDDYFNNTNYLTKLN